MVTQTQGEPYGGHDVVFEYERSASDPYAVAAGDPKLIVDVPASAVNHNGGSVLFGPDGMLYVGTGDGGGGCNNDKPGAPQDVTSLYGKILRLNPKAAAPHAAAGNPFSDDPRVLHYGLRNPFRFGFDRLTGDLYIGDVGQDDYEEISFAPSGSTALNFGWPDFEGNAGDTCGGAADIRPGSTHTRPIFVADRSGQGGATYRDYRSIIGGFVYRGSAVAKLQGAYVFGDYVGQRLGALYQCGAQTSPVTPIRKACDLNNPSEACLAPQNGAPAVNALMGILEGSDGEMYLVANRTTLYKVVPN
jgi:glucose/arabinose dehydrogenase